MNGYQWVESPHAGRVNRPHHELLARAALARNQQVRIGRSDGLDGLEHLAYGQALSDEIARTRSLGYGLSQSNILFLRPFVRECLLHEMRNLIRIQRLADIV